MRPSWDAYFMGIVSAVSLRGSCLRRKVGAVAVDYRNVVLATGYNGKASGTPNCEDQPCAGAYAKSGEGLDSCEAIHAELQCLVFCSDTSKIHTLYVSCSPCVSCVKVLMQTGCSRIVFMEEYPHPTSKSMWLLSKEGRKWEQFKT